MRAAGGAGAGAADGGGVERGGSARGVITGCKRGEFSMERAGSFTVRGFDVFAGGVVCVPVPVFCPPVFGGLFGLGRP